jgi:hypothetical protein
MACRRYAIALAFVVYWNGYKREAGLRKRSLFRRDDRRGIAKEKIKGKRVPM